MACDAKKEEDRNEVQYNPDSKDGGVFWTLVVVKVAISMLLFYGNGRWRVRRKHNGRKEGGKKGRKERGKEGQG